MHWQNRNLQPGCRLLPSGVQLEPGQERGIQRTENVQKVRRKISMNEPPNCKHCVCFHTAKFSKILYFSLPNEKAPYGFCDYYKDDRNGNYSIPDCGKFEQKEKMKKK
jgi:hypothetical protein